MQYKITKAIDALILAAVIEGGVSDEKLPASRELTNLRKSELMEAISAPCLHQIQEPAPVTATDALREAEAALEVAMARILKADPGHSICVTSEAKALAAVRAALAATPADHVADAGKMVLPEPDAGWFKYDKVSRCWHPQYSEYADSHAKREGWQKLYTEQQVRALLATGGQAQAVEQAPILYVSKGQLDNHSDPDGPDSANAGRYLPCRITPAGKFTTPLFAAPQAQADARDADDADLIEWLSGQYLAADFQWGDPKTPVLVIEIPATTSVCGDFRTDVRAAIAAAKGE